MVLESVVCNGTQLGAFVDVEIRHCFRADCHPEHCTSRMAALELSLRGPKEMRVVQRKEPPW